MYFTNNHFEELAGKVCAGDLKAKGQFQRDLEPCMLRIITRALSPDAAPSPLHRRILALSRQFHPGPLADADQRRELARTLCQRVITRLAPTDTEARDCLATLLG